MNFFRPKKSFHEIIAPVSGIISDLEQYEQDQAENIEHEKALINKLQASVNDRQNGISQSSHVRGNIAAILKFPDPVKHVVEE